MPSKEQLREPLFEMTTAFRGDYPNITISEETLRAVAEDDPQPFFTTLRIGKVGALSRNKTMSGKNRLYGEQAVRSIMQQVNNGLGGIKGHQDFWDSSFTLPVLRWLGAEMDAEGVLWGKAYVPTYAQDVRAYLKDSMKFNSDVGTSIYGNAEIDEETGEVLMVDLEGIDLVGAKRVGVTAAVDVPRVTAESLHTEGDVMPDEIHQEQVEQAAEIRAVELAELTAERDRLQSELAEMQTTLETVTSERDSALSRVAELESENLTHTIESLIGEMVELERLRPAAMKHIALLRRVGDVTSEETARGAISAYLSDEDTKVIAQSIVNEMSGGNAIVGAGRGEESKLPSEDEARAMGAKFVQNKK